MRQIYHALLLSSLTFPARSGAFDAEASELQWPYSLPPHEKYFPEHEPVIKRNLVARKRLDKEAPRGLKKMSEDAGQMFFMEYWRWGDVDERIALGAHSLERRTWSLSDGERGGQPNNGSILHSNHPPLKVQLEYATSPNPLYRRLLRSPITERDFTCPAGTSSCTNISRPNSCCPTDEACQIVPNTGLGDVGCCAAGQQCSGSLDSCSAGYTPCPGDLGGGCCVPGYQCAGVGCILASTATIVIIPTVTAAPPSTTSSITPLPPPIITTTSSVASFTSTPSPSSSAPITSLPTTSSLLPSTLTCSSGFQSCPASLGGGCCPTDRACGSALCSATSTSLAGTSSSNALGAPVRPTSIESTITGTTTVAATFPPTSTLGASQCPTGFYQCSAYYVGGACCRVGRDCSMTDCPAASTGTALVSDGVTVAVVTVPSGTATAAAGAVVVGTCANGWQTCPATQGGGCCPSDFTCAEQNCVKQVTEVTGGSSGASSSVVRLNWDLWSGIGITVAAFLFVFCV